MLSGVVTLRLPAVLPFAAVLLLAWPVGCGDDDRPARDGGGGGGEACGPVTCGAGSYCCDHCTGFCAADGTGPACRPLGEACDDGGSADGGLGGDAGALSDASIVACAFVSGLEKGCAGDDTCVIGIHQIDCCGSKVAIGMSQSERDRFDTAEAACVASYPGCFCPELPTEAEDGMTTTDPSTIGVACNGGTCSTFVAP